MDHTTIGVDLARRPSAGCSPTGAPPSSGVGLITATAYVALIGVGRFPTARHFASYLGLTPRERSSGLRRRRGATSKRGDSLFPSRSS
jgi:hypothetical protein